MKQSLLNTEVTKSLVEHLESQIKPLEDQVKPLESKLSEIQQELTPIQEKIQGFRNAIKAITGVKEEKEVKTRKRGPNKTGRKNNRIGWNEMIIDVMKSNPNKKFTVKEIVEQVKPRLKQQVENSLIQSSIGSILSAGRDEEFNGVKQGRKYLYSLK